MSTIPPLLQYIDAEPHHVPIEPPMSTYSMYILATYCLKNRWYKCCQTQLQYMRAPVENTLSVRVGLLPNSQLPGISVLFILGVDGNELLLRTVCLHKPGIHISNP